MINLKIIFGCLVALSLSLVTTKSQGLISFTTFFPEGEVNAPVRLTSGQLVGSGWRAQLYATPAGQPLSSLKPQFPVAEFQDRFPGYIFGQYEVNVTIPPGTIATVVMRAFNGLTYESSLFRGESKPINITLNGGLQPGSHLEGLQCFTVNSIPEPSSIAIAALGFCLFALGHRLKIFLRRN